MPGARWASSAEKNFKCCCACEKWLNPTRLRCECLRIEKSNFPSLGCSFASVNGASGRQMKGENSFRGWNRCWATKKKWRKEMNEDNGKSNFCITKHFALCVLQAENFDIAWVTTMGRMFFLPQARANEAQKGTEERLACIHSAQVEKCLVMKTTLDVCVLSSMEDSKRNSTQTPVGCCLCYTIPVDLGAT